MGTFTNASAANDYMTGRKPLPTPQGAEVVAVRFTIDMATADLNTSDIGAFAKLPAGCVPAGLPIVDGTDMDTGAAALVLNVGIMNTAADSALSTDAEDGGGSWGATTAANAAFTQTLTPTGKNLMSVTAAATDRLVGVLVDTGATTPATGTLGLTLFYRNA